MNTRAGLTGGCQCGQVKYRLKEEPLALYACHCLDCQKQSSSAFGMSMWMHREAVEFYSGQLSFWTTRDERGAQKICAFCGNCGSRIYHAAGDEPKILSMKAGSLDDTSWLQPTCHLWTKRMQPWVRIDSKYDKCYASEPPNDEELMRQYTQK